jgi:hypothetical protein
MSDLMSTERTHAIDMSAIAQSRVANTQAGKTSIDIQNLNLFYADKQALHNINMQIHHADMTAQFSNINTRTIDICAFDTDITFDSGAID